MSLKLPIELLATWNGGAASEYYDGLSPVPGVRYKLAVEKHKIDVNAVKVLILSRADGSVSANQYNWAPYSLQ